MDFSQRILRPIAFNFEWNMKGKHKIKGALELLEYIKHKNSDLKCT